jgi:signal transduction histidine kinase
MTWTLALILVAAVTAAFAAGLVIGLARDRARLRRVSEGVAELADGNHAHRVLLPGDDMAAGMAADLNRFADAIQQEHEASANRDDARRRLLADISHDLRTPITSIAGYVDALSRGIGDEPDRYLAVLAAKADELAQLTDDLFYASRLDAGDLELKTETLDLAEVARRSVLGFESQLSGVGARVDVSIPEEPCLVLADRSAVSRILSNLVSNGLRHGAGMTALRVVMVELGESYAVEVTNEGSRLPEDADRLFERGVAGPAGGTGLGLSIARELAERMGATVAADAHRPDAVTFTLTFPKSGDARAPEFSET